LTCLEAGEPSPFESEVIDAAALFVTKQRGTSGSSASDACHRQVRVPYFKTPPGTWSVNVVATYTLYTLFNGFTTCMNPNLYLYAFQLGLFIDLSGFNISTNYTAQYRNYPYVGQVPNTTALTGHVKMVQGDLVTAGAWGAIETPITMYSTATIIATTDQEVQFSNRIAAVGPCNVCPQGLDTAEYSLTVSAVKLS
jgi:hypothetical protein